MKKVSKKKQKVIVTYIEQVGENFIPKMRNYHDDEEGAMEFINNVLILRNVVPSSISVKTYQDYEIIDTEEN